MGDEAKLTWGREQRGLSDRWPRDAEGTPEKPVFLTHTFGDELQINMLTEMLRSYEIPAIKKYEDHGTLGKVVLGFSGTGVSIYVPESMLEDAQNLLEPVEDTDPDTDTSNQ